MCRNKIMMYIDHKYGYYQKIDTKTYNNCNLNASMNKNMSNKKQQSNWYPVIYSKDVKDENEGIIDIDDKYIKCYDNINDLIDETTINNGICAGFDRHRNKCNCRTKDNSRFCHNHQYMNSFSDEDLKDIELNGERVKKCSIGGKYECVKWNNHPKYKTCDSCRKRGRKKDAKRRNSEARVKWREENYDKIVGYWTDYRQRKINELGAEEYNRRQAESAKKWRDAHPEYMEQQNEKQRHNKNRQLRYYVNRAEKCGYEWYLNDDQFFSLIEEKCFYCGEIDDVNFNGVDRKINNIGYTKDNCVSCCEMCNIIKNDTVNDDVYLKQVYHIVCYTKLVDDKKNYLNLFSNSCSSNYKCVTESANKRDIDFELSKNQFNFLKLQKCYLCGKQTNDYHINGIDRLDSTIGYIFDNCISCCCTCNYLKNKYDLKDFLRKLYLTYCKHQNKEQNLENFNKNILKFQHKIITNLNETYKNTNYEDDEEKLKNFIINAKENVSNEKKEQKNIIDKPIKMTKEQIQEREKLIKQEKREKLVERYNDEEYKKNKGIELKEKRLKRKREN